jgi:integrase
MLDLRKKNYIDWNVKSVIKLLDRNNYAYRIVLTFEDGTKQVQQKSGFHTKREAENARKRTIGELTNGTYIVNSNVKVKDFLEYWLEYDIRQRVGSFNTYDSYSNIVKNHVVPFLGKKKISELNRGDIQKLYQNRANYSIHIAKQVKTVLNVSLRYAVEQKMIPVNLAEGLNLPKTDELNSYHVRSIDTQKTLTMEQVKLLIAASKDTPIHMQVLFNVLMGLRRQEINGVKYSDVDYINRTLTIERQLGKELIRNTNESVGKTTTKKEVSLKTPSSYRVLPILDYVFEAILEERKKYEKNRSRRKTQFLDEDYICCSTYGKPRSKDFHWKHYKNLLKSIGLPDIRWHDLRSTYCTLLLKNDFSPKAVSDLMGHAKELVTIDVYGDNRRIIPEEIPELISYMQDVMPKKIDERSIEGNVLDIVIDVNEYLSK